MDYARYQTELAISEHSLVDMPPSEIAFAAILNAMEGMDLNLLPPKTQSKFVRTVEKVAGILHEDVIVIQSTLSMLLCNLVKDDEEVLEACIESDLEQDYETAAAASAGSSGGGVSRSMKHRQQSPVSVTRKSTSATQ